MVGALKATGKDPARAVLEAIALEAYRSDLLTTAEIRKLLGLSSRMDVDAFLKEYGAFLPYREEDLAHDIEVASRTARRTQSENMERPPDQRLAG